MKETMSKIKNVSESKKTSIHRKTFVVGGIVLASAAAYFAFRNLNGKVDELSELVKSAVDLKTPTVETPKK